MKQALDCAIVWDVQNSMVYCVWPGELENYSVLRNVRNASCGTTYHVGTLSEPLPTTTTGHYIICCKNLSLTLLKMGKRLPKTCWANLGDQ